MRPMPTLALLDGHNLAYRAFYALPSDLATSAGQVTNAVFGFTSMLIKLLGEESPDAIAVAWDTAGPTFRKERFEEYKAQREAPPDLFRSQLPLIREVLEVLEITQIGVPGIEADDIIATLAERAENEGWDAVVLTGDRDAFQLVDDHVVVHYIRRGVSDTVRADAGWVAERYGVTPEQYPQYAALRGDTSDNLPGVPGVGEKTAARLISEYGSLEAIYEHLDEQTPKLRENLAAHRDRVFLNHELMVLRRDADLGEVDLDDLSMRPWDPARVKEVFDGLAFRTLWDRLVSLGGASPAEGTERHLDVDVRTEMDPEEVAALAAPGRLVLEPVWDDGDLAGLMVAVGDDAARFVPVGAVSYLAPALSDPAVGVIAHDAKPMIGALADLGIDVRGLAFDTALAAYVVNPAQRAPDLDELALRELGVEVGRRDGGDAVGAGDQGAFDFERRGPDLEGAGRRAVAVSRLAGPLREQLEARGSAGLYDEVELPLVRVLARMERTGIAVDRDYLTSLGEELRRRLGELETRIHEAAGGPFNINSSLQLREVLFERLELPVLKKTPKGAPSTDATVLAKLVDEHQIVADLMAYRELEKLRSTYVDALLPLIQDDGRIRGRFNQMAAATGRLSAEQPNLQNIPIRSEEGRTIRKAFVARPGTRFVVADYSQIELRILAHLSGDAGLLEAFRTDEDIHRATAARIFGVAAAEVTPEMRRRAKVVNFGLLYGMEAYGLGQRLDLSREEAQEQIDLYFAGFPDVQEYLEGVVADARSTGYTTTLLGRRRYLPELSSSNFRDRQAGERMALNAPIQGTAADIIKKAMVVLDAELERTGSEADLVLQVHDELVVEVPAEEMDAVPDLIRSVMEGIVELRVPLRVEVATGSDLAECKG
jgi:DNA polymerase I